MPELSIPLEELRQKKLFLGTPMYGGQCAGMFARSVMDLSALCTHYQIPMMCYFLFNESLITRARNYICDEFMRSDATHLMFIDSDIGFTPQDVLLMMGIMKDDSPYDILGGPYPKKCISWEKIKLAVDKGVADQNPSELEKFVGDYVFNPKNGQNQIPLHEPVEVLELGTGFMMIKKKSMEIFQKEYSQYMYRPDHVRTEHFDGTREIMQFFQAEIEPVNKRYLSEDYWFTQKSQQIGLRTWLCPWMRLQHMGSYIFGGSLIDLAAIGAPATADPNMLKNREKDKNKKKK